MFRGGPSTAVDPSDLKTSHGAENAEMVDPVKPSEDYSRTKMRMRLWKRTCWTVGEQSFWEKRERTLGPFGGFEGSDDFDVYYDGRR